MKIRLAAIDDSPIMLAVYNHLLPTFGDFDIVLYNNPTLFMEKMTLETFDILLTDLNLPDIHGIEIIRRVRESRFNARIPIFVVSGERDPKLLRRARVAGADEVLSKPIEPLVLRDRIATGLLKANARKEREARTEWFLERGKGCEQVLPIGCAL